MAEKREILFWQQQAHRGLLIKAIRAYRERAIRFFGAVAVLSEDESTLFRTLEAHTIVSASMRNLLVKMNRVPVETISKLQDFPPAELEIIRKRMRFTLEDVSILQRNARQHLQRVTGQAGKCGD